MTSSRYKFLSKLKEDAINNNKKHSEQLYLSPQRRAESPVRYSKNFTKDDLEILSSVIDEDSSDSNMCFGAGDTNDDRYVIASSCCEDAEITHCSQKDSSTSIISSQARSENTEISDATLKIGAYQSSQTNSSTTTTIPSVTKVNVNAALVNNACCKNLMHSPGSCQATLTNTQSPLLTPSTSAQITQDISMYDSPNLSTFIAEQIIQFNNVNTSTLSTSKTCASDIASLHVQSHEHSQHSACDNPLMRSLDPSLAAISNPESTLMLTNSTSQIGNNVSTYESPNLSPFINEQINQLHSADSRSMTPATPATAALISTVNLRAPETLDCNSIESDSTMTNQLSTKRKSRKNVSRAYSGKKRKLDKSQWADTLRKKNKNSGKVYKSRDGKTRQQRNMGPTCKNTCKLKCSHKLDQSIRQKLFDTFWSMGELVRQWDFIDRYCQRIHKRRVTTETDSRRQYTIRYFLPIENENNPQPLSSNNNSTPLPGVQVCKVMFLNTLGVKQGVVYSAINKLASKDTITQDQRGRHNNHKKVITSAMIASVCDHVKSFAPVESHYVRSRSNKLYLDESLSVARMFVLYVEWEDPENREKVMTCRQYRDIVNSNFNLGFHIPKKDSCDVCHINQNLPKPLTEQETTTFSAHIRNKNIARELKCKDKEHSLRDKTILTAVYDFEKVHGLPYGEMSILYYKRKLSVFNFTVFDMGTKTAKCYVWDETVAKRGANEVASCLYDYIEEHTQRGIKTFNFWSDNCGGQNRNRIVFAAYLRAAKDFNVVITHKYLEKGHTQNEGDSVHALIERTAKHKIVYTPDQWYALIRWAKQDKNPYIVKEMTTTDFIDFKVLLPGCNWTADTDGGKMFWSHIRQLEVSPNSTDSIHFKTEFCDHEFKNILVCATHETPKTRNRLRNKAIIENTQLPFHSRRLQQAYEGKLAVPKAKLQDLHYLCSHNIIPALYHGYYMSLKEGDENIANDEEEG